MDVNLLVQSAAATLMAAAWKIAGAFALWFVGRWLIVRDKTLGGLWRDRNSTPRSRDTSRPASR